MASNKKIILKLSVDKKKNRFLFAESGADFVDVLLNFWTLPIGTIIRLSEKKSDIGCMDRLYKSVEALDIRYLNTEACKAMLLSPRMEFDSQRRCENLVLKIDNNNRDIYSCPNWTCSTETHNLVSMFSNTTCLCGRKMDRKTIVKAKADEVFVEGTRSQFMIGDNLMIKPFSSTNYWSLLRQFGINDSKDVEERIVAVGREEVLRLLKQSLVSKTPMKDVFLKKQKQSMYELFKDLFLKKKKECKPSPKSEPFNVINWDSKSIKLKLFVSKSNNKVQYAEANEEFVDLLFSFLTFPLGSIMKLLDRSFSIGSVADMYKGVESLCNEDEDVLLEQCKKLLLKPKVAFHHGIKNQLLNIEEAKSWQLSTLKRSTCFGENKRKVKKRVMNPKFVNTTTESGGGYVKGQCSFIVTDDLQVKPLSLASYTMVARDLGVPFSDLEEKEAAVGEYEALSLLRSSLTSDKVLTEVFCRTKAKWCKKDSMKEAQWWWHPAQ